MHSKTLFKKPFAKPKHEPSTPVLGEESPVQPHQPAEPSAQQRAPEQQAQNGSGIYYERPRPEASFGPQAKRTEEEGQMKNDLRYTSVMKKHEHMSTNIAGKKVAAISDRSDNVLLKITAVFPFDFFPNTVVIDANKVSVIDRIFFASESITTILLEEITDVVVESNFFLGRLVITYSHHPLQPYTYAVPALKKQDAIRAQEIIQGLIVLRISEGIDLSKLKPDEIKKELEHIGRTHENVATL